MLNKKQKAVINMAKFLKSQSLDLLGKIEELNLDDHAELCEHLHEQAEALLNRLTADFAAQAAQPESVN